MSKSAYQGLPSNKIKGRFFAPKENKRVILARTFVKYSKEKIIVKFYV